MAMLLCLDRKHRLAYILGDIFELDQSEASHILAISKENYRKQLSRARSKVVHFTRSSCGLVSESARCSCDKKLRGAMRRGRVNPKQLQFADKSEHTYEEVQQQIHLLKEDLKTLTLQNSVPRYKGPEDFGLAVERLMKPG